MILAVKAPVRGAGQEKWIVEVVFGSGGPSKIQFASRESAQKGYERLLEQIDRPKMPRKRVRRK